MTRYRCPECCCGPAIVLHPPNGSVPVCSRCRTVMERQPLVRPVPLFVLLTVGSAWIAFSIPALLARHQGRLRLRARPDEAVAAKQRRVIR